MVLVLLLLAALIFTLFWLQMESTPVNFPPGPIRFPVVGHLPLLGPKAHKTLLKWKESYGPVIGVWFGSYRSLPGAVVWLRGSCLLKVITGQNNEGSH
ncbi:unnamed protein product [Allacma fusca]|uniref:Uncharacterized protein n=1 Tax=Allacma fusca TaxID=39272 RepID=A0A8J2KDL5_9HEXA|nr:unnamed protein product [Allacma fusca]